ncbi:uncharacterized protein LOC133323989 [Musca vetustissima]|uniref:uncharacterized protein LOC133323989 n=1 Tax=Musca vetustissima TaxID=27455 RepID=UPI002AB6B2C7|nr:uncharacterized protein LOC133323989 [Musca vetustissima]
MYTLAVCIDIEGAFNNVSTETLIQSLEAFSVDQLSHTSFAFKEIIGMLDNNHELKREEVNALRPLFEELQRQYDFIMAEFQKDGNKVDAKFGEVYEATVKDFQEQFASLMQEEATTVYDTSLPTVEEIMGKPDFTQMTPEQINEYLDLQSILQDMLDETQESLNDLVSRALQLESNLLKINKPKIIMAILNALGTMYKVAGRVGRASYCTYSHVPQLNASLHHVYDGVDCYLFTTKMIVAIQNETYDTVKVVRKTISDLASVYKKVASKNTIMGKIVSMLLNLKKILWSVGSTLRQANRVIDDIVNKMPDATVHVYDCGTTLVDRLPFVVESVANVTECILFVDDSKPDYGFLDPEDSTRIPELYPDPESGEDIDASFEMP